ncbi:MAG: hypothetical protein PHE86_03025 [Candidatus Marinimicrobia bacterium]|nr:hypothetical protein [Candidatus Neomarinimicrobiota bacterium]
MKNLTFLKGFFLFFTLNVTCIQAENTPDVKTKSGLNVGAVPAIAYNTDTGFRYGIVVNLFHYGDGSLYPNYRYSIYTELSRTTKGSGTNQLFFDSKYLLPHGIRITAEINYLTEQTLDFYGFNGRESTYNKALTDDDSNNPDYISRVFYRHERNLLRLTTDFQGKLVYKNLRWLAGFGYFNNEIGPVNIDALNKGLDDDEKLPEVPGLYDKYVQWGIIPPNQADGGVTTFFKIGAIYDTRDNDANPMRGMWTEGILLAAPSSLGNSAGDYTQLSLTHRQYFTLIPHDLSFALRLAYQGNLSGDIPFYMLPFYMNSYLTYACFGAAKTIRGVLRNRLVGDAVAFGNAELRWKFTYFTLFNQNFYLALNAFVDGGTVLDRWEFDQSRISDELYHIETKKDNLHLSYGGGFRIAMNENFIIAADYGVARDKNDGNTGLYIGIGYLF